MRAKVRAAESFSATTERIAKKLKLSLRLGGSSGTVASVSTSSGQNGWSTSRQVDGIGDAREEAGGEPQ